MSPPAYLLPILGQRVASYCYRSMTAHYCRPVSLSATTCSDTKPSVFPATSLPLFEVRLMAPFPFIIFPLTTHQLCMFRPLPQPTRPPRASGIPPTGSLPANCLKDHAFSAPCQEDYTSKQQVPEWDPASRKPMPSKLHLTT